jgi:uncharacterized protein YbaR (Trm112 family)
MNFFRKFFRDAVSSASVIAPVVKRKVIRPPSDLLEVLVCPLSKGKLIYFEKTHEIISPSAALAYPVGDNGTINLIPYDARIVKEASVSSPEEDKELWDFVQQHQSARLQ